MNYKHTQIGYLIISISIILLLYFIGLFIYTELNSTVTIIMLLVLVILSSFTTLNVIIDENYLKIKFGYGIFRKQFPLKEITSVKTVKNHWYYGWGIRLWLWPKMWIYNVSGFDAVEIKLKDNKTYRIGTDEAKELGNAIKSRIT